MAIVTGERGGNAPSQRWAASMTPNATLCTCSKAGQGGRFPIFKKPVRFTSNHRAFLEW